jgi:hypothetical protein
VYNILSLERIELPRNAVLERDGINEPEFEEDDDHVIVNGVTFNKPFVEKPIDAEVYII